MISLPELIQNISQYNHPHHAWCFVGSEYPAFFFTQCKSLFEKTTGLQWHSLAPTSMSLDELVHHLSMSFLGERKLYFLGNMTTVDASLLAWCHVYKGPHLIMYYSSQTAPQQQTLHIVIPETISAQDYTQLMPLLYKSPADTHFFNDVTKAIKQIDLDTACGLMHYQSLLGKRYQEFTQTWLPKIAPIATSLFTLSTHFFARDKEAFLKLWQITTAQYAEEFWTSYWSDQLWHASLFIMQTNTSGAEKAARTTNRLPFSFTQRDWKKYSLSQIASAHEELLRIDSQFKNGATLLQLETWLLKWLNGK